MTTDFLEKCIFNMQYKSGFSTSADLFEDRDVFFSGYTQENNDSSISNACGSSWRQSHN
jgi:hypothetical protein